MATDFTVQYIRVCLQQGRFVVADHARDAHPIREGFTVGQGIAALLRGAVIEDHSSRERLLFCGEGEGVRPDTRFHGAYIHVVVEVDVSADVVVITMYRPAVTGWRTPWKRR